MAIRKILMDNFITVSDEKEMSIFLSEIITFLHDVNEQQIPDLVELQVYSREKAASRIKTADDLLRQALEITKENMKLLQLTKKAIEMNAIIAERDKLRASISRAQALINEAKLETEKAQRGAINKTKKQLQITRDRIVTVAETSQILGEQIVSAGNISTMIDTVNNILANIGLVSDEMQSLGLWDEEDIKPKYNPITYTIDTKEKQVEKKPVKKKGISIKTPKPLDDSEILEPGKEENQPKQISIELNVTEDQPNPLAGDTDDKGAL